MIALAKAFEKARKGKIRTHDEHAFDLMWDYDLVALRDAILERRYEVSPSIVFVIFDPMVREIFAAAFRDRVVHHFLYQLQGGWWDQHFIYDSYSCRVGKGTLCAQQRVQKMLRSATRGGPRKAWVAKNDIRGYFMSLPRAKLVEKVNWGLERQFACVMDDPMGYQLYSICKYLWEMVLTDDPTVNARRRGPAWNWDPAILPASKSLFSQPPGYGLPIGNVTSQLASNIYMDEFDRYVHFELGYKYYGRYVDDFIRISDDHDKMLADVPLMEKFLFERMELVLHKDKRYFQQATKGVDFVGAKIYASAIRPGRRLRAKFPVAVERLVAGEGEFDTVESYVGLMRHIDAEDYVESTISCYNSS